MTLATGRDISVYTLDGWLAESKEGRNLPHGFANAWADATESTIALEYVATQDPTLARRLRIGEIETEGRTTIQAEIHEGTKRDAILYACGANATNGIRRTSADKRQAVERLLNDEEWAKWSDREIAGRAAVGKSFVSNPRNEMASVHGGQIDRRQVTRKTTT